MCRWIFPDVSNGRSAFIMGAQHFVTLVTIQITEKNS